jgi:hypothetical protein
MAVHDDYPFNGNNGQKVERKEDGKEWKGPKKAEFEWMTLLGFLGSGERISMALALAIGITNSWQNPWVTFYCFSVHFLTRFSFIYKSHKPFPVPCGWNIFQMNIYEYIY